MIGRNLPKSNLNAVEFHLRLGSEEFCRSFRRLGFAWTLQKPSAAPFDRHTHCCGHCDDRVEAARAGSLLDVAHRSLSSVREFRELLKPHFVRVELLGVFHARKLRMHELAIRAGWDRLHPALGVTTRFYERFVPAIDERDFTLRDGDLDRCLDMLAVCRP
jgi:hypothetical protein